MELDKGKVTHVRCVRLQDNQHRDLAVALAENDAFLEYNGWKREDPEYDEWLKNNKHKKVTIAPQVIKKPDVNSTTITELSDKVVSQENKSVEQPGALSSEPKKRKRKNQPA